MSRNLAYAGSPGQSWPEEAWVKALAHRQGLSKEAAQAEINADIAAKRIVVVEEAK